MKTLIIYDDFASATKASATLQQSAQSPAISVQWNTKLWRLGLLKFPPTAEEALTESLDAHLIVFARPCAQWVPFCSKTGQSQTFTLCPEHTQKPNLSRLDFFG
jgi:hypothetical protein